MNSPSKKPVSVEAVAARRLSDRADTLRAWSEAGERFDDAAEPKRRDLVNAMADMAEELGLLSIADDLREAADAVFEPSP